MKIWISFPFDTFQDTAKALEFLYPFINIPIASIMSNRSYPDGYESFDLAEALEKLEENLDKTFLLSSDIAESMDETNRIAYIAIADKYAQYFVLTLEREENFRLPELMVAAGTKGMTFSYKCDFWKAYWQSVELINTYENEKRPHGHLKKITDPSLPPIIGHKIDISGNPGHERLTYSMKLMAAPEMWFGPGSWKYFDRDLVSCFPDAEEIRDLGGDILYVKLFDWETPDYEAGKILNLQEKFRKWTRMNEVEDQLQGLLKK